MSIISIGIPIPDSSALPGQTGSGEEVNLQYATQNYCNGTGVFTPTVATPAGGVFTDNSSDPNLFQVNPTTGTFNLGVSDPGNYTVTYTVNGDSANFPINITAVQDSSFSYSASAFCKDASNQTPTITTPGGSFTTQDITFHPFQMQFDTSGGKTITIPGTVGSSFTVDWGDGNTTTETGGTISHTYASGRATSTVSIGATGDSGAFTTFQFNNSGSKSDLIDITQWGSIVWSSMEKMFWGCDNTNFTTITATDTPNLSICTSLTLMFYNCHYLQSINNINNWDVSNITNIGQIFRAAYVFNQDISSWDTSSITTYFYAFFSARAFNQNLSNWTLNTSLSSILSTYADSGIQINQYTDTIVGWAVQVSKNSAPYTVNMGNQYPIASAYFDCTRTQDTDNSGNSVDYSTKYGSDWTAAGWTDAGDALNFLIDSTRNWTIYGLSAGCV
jgi:surface protein